MMRTPYTGSTIAFATMHGKERLAREAFRTFLGAAVVAPTGIDTDRFGTFAGDIPRLLTPLEAARAKVRLAIDSIGLPAVLASEGSFTTEFGWTTRQSEHVLFWDENRGIELIESCATSFTVPPGRHVSTSTQATSYARSLGFPDQGLIVQAHHEHGIVAHKELRSQVDLELAVERLLGENLEVSVLPDYRAHRSPARAEIIRTLCARMARRLATPCPGCGAPGYGRVSAIPGLPCSLCGTPTHRPAADVHACARCEITHTRQRTSHADPQWCDACNP